MSTLTNLARLFVGPEIGAASRSVQTHLRHAKGGKRTEIPSNALTAMGRLINGYSPIYIEWRQNSL